jgi:hypothetical protein
VNKDTYYKSSQISDWYTDGNAVRMFIANDRPSAVRFWFLLRNGKPDEINTLSYGGYNISDDENKVLKHATISMNENYCKIMNTPIRGGGGGGCGGGGSLKKRTNNTMKNKKNKKHRYSIKKNKKNKNENET